MRIPEFKIGAPNQMESFRVRHFFYEGSTATRSHSIDLICRLQESGRILGAALSTYENDQTVQLRIDPYTSQFQKAVHHQLLAAWLSHANQHFPDKMIVTPPLNEGDPLLQEWEQQGFLIKNTFREVEYNIDRASHLRMERIIAKLKQKIPSDAHIKPYEPKYFQELNRQLTAHGLIPSEQLRELTSNPYQGYDRDLSAVLLLEEQIIGCILVTVPHQEVCRLDVRWTDHRFRGGFAWANALLIHHLTSRTQIRNLRRIQYRYDLNTMKESGNLARGSIIPTRHLSHSYVFARYS